MRKLSLVVLTVVLAGLALAFGPAAKDQAMWLYNELPDLEITGTVTEMGFLEGHFYLKLSADGKTYDLLIPLVALRELELEIKTGDEIEVSGKMLQGKDGTFVIVDTVKKDGKEYNIRETMREMVRKRVQEMRKRYQDETRQPMGRNMRDGRRRAPMGGNW